MESKNSFPPTTIPTIISIVMLFAGIPKFLPYGYYTLLRWVVCATGAYIAFLSFEGERKIIGSLSVVVALLFNPIIPIHLDKEVWVVVDLIVGIFLGITIYALRREQVNYSSKIKTQEREKRLGDQNNRVKKQVFIECSICNKLRNKDWIVYQEEDNPVCKDCIGRDQQQIDLQEQLQQHDIENLRLMEYEPEDNINRTHKRYAPSDRIHDQRLREQQQLEVLEMLEQHDLENLRLMGYEPEDEAKTYINKTHKRHVPLDVRKAVWRRDKGICVKCGKKENIQYDHIIPISKGGSSTVANIELLCQSCNIKKSDKIE